MLMPVTRGGQNRALLHSSSLQGYKKVQRLLRPRRPKPQRQRLVVRLWLLTLLLPPQTGLRDEGQQMARRLRSPTDRQRALWPQHLAGLRNRHLRALTTRQVGCSGCSWTLRCRVRWQWQWSGRARRDAVRRTCGKRTARPGSSSFGTSASGSSRSSGCEEPWTAHARTPSNEHAAGEGSTRVPYRVSEAKSFGPVRGAG
mmetsp:Transcript_68220/g.171930  ORF Transcript_68220/g.171930 Transcript_68220/m.171930 type:complete len:200 (+) Transcript_68220:148-747(+)